LDGRVCMLGAINKTANGSFNQYPAVVRQTKNPTEAGSTKGRGLGNAHHWEQGRTARSG
jgi:hypothetical protein